MLVVNTAVVRALMTLRGMSRATLAKAAGVREDNLRAWLSNSDTADLCMARKNQILVLRALGIDEDTPRSDTVHSWCLDESRGARSAEGFAALQTVLGAYGNAEVIYFGAEEDPVFSLRENVHFGLRFSRFRVILTVKPGLFRDVQFSPDLLKDLKWAEENPVCLLPTFRFEQIINADITSAEFDDFAKGQVEMAKWESLHLLAREHQITPEDIAKWMFVEVEEREARVSLTFDDTKTHILLEETSLPTNVFGPAESKAPAPAAGEEDGQLPSRTAEVNSIAEHRLFVKRG